MPEKMPERIWAYQYLGEWYTTTRYPTEVMAEKLGIKLIKYIPSTPAREHAEEMRITLKTIVEELTRLESFTYLHKEALIMGIIAIKAVPDIVLATIEAEEKERCEG